MSYDNETLSYIFDKTGGRCRFCGKTLAWRNYGKNDARGSWEVDHGIPISRGGTDYLQNLWAVCTECNREKGSMTSREFERYLIANYDA